MPLTIRRLKVHRGSAPVEAARQLLRRSFPNVDVLTIERGAIIMARDMESQLDPDTSSARRAHLAAKTRRRLAAIGLDMESNHPGQ
jgi:isoaspartyl peptidase/L-asparaginase-like protein (Ntn-hydrolase superfamily)